MSKLFGIGMRVRFVRTGEEGVIKERLEDGMLNVYLPADDMTIPAFEEDLVRVEDFWTSAKSTGTFIPEKPKPAPKLNTSVPSGAPYRPLRSTGLLAAFEADPPGDLTPKQYRIFLINDTKHDLAVVFELYVGGHQVAKMDDLLASYTFKSCGALRYDDLNEVPEIDIFCQRITTEGVAAAHEKTVKIKPANFFKNLKAAPLLSREAHLVMLIEKPENDPSDREAGESLSEYTKRNIRKQPPTPRKVSYVTVHDLHAKASFVDEIDLHIEKLTADHARMSNTEIITLQLRRFDDFLAKAIRIGVERVFVIHGVGKGVLRDEIHRKLRHNHHVIDYKNEYHHKYGWGATEVILK